MLQQDALTAAGCSRLWSDTASGTRPTGPQFSSGAEQSFGTVTWQQPSHGGWVGVDQYPCCGEHRTWAMAVVWLT